MDTYKVLIAVGDHGERAKVRAALESAGCIVIGEAQDREALPGMVSESRPDVLLLDTAWLPEEGQILSSETDWAGPILLLTGPDRSVSAERITRSGAFGTLALPVRPEEAVGAIGLAVRRFRELQGCQENLDRLQVRLADRIIIERAKGKLMREEGLEEEDAFKRIHFSARRQNRTMRGVAEEILNSGQTPVEPSKEQEVVAG